MVRDAILVLPPEAETVTTVKEARSSALVPPISLLRLISAPPVAWIRRLEPELPDLMVVLLGLEAVPTVMDPVPTDLNCTSLFNTMLASKLTGKPEVVDCKTKVFAELVSPKVTRLALAAAPPVFVV